MWLCFKIHSMSPFLALGRDPRNCIWLNGWCVPVCDDFLEGSKTGHAGQQALSIFFKLLFWPNLSSEQPWGLTYWFCPRDPPSRCHFTEMITLAFPRADRWMLHVQDLQPLGTCQNGSSLCIWAQAYVLKQSAALVRPRRVGKEVWGIHARHLGYNSFTRKPQESLIHWPFSNWSR